MDLSQVAFIYSLDKFHCNTIVLYTVPASVPPVPVANVTALTVPFVCSQISGPVVSMCALLLAVLSN